MGLVLYLGMGHDRPVPSPDCKEPYSKRTGDWPNRAARTLLGFGLGAAVISCESEPVAVVHLSVGNRPEERRSFQPKASLAEYTEIAGYGTEMRVILSSHPISCDAYLPLEKDQVLVTLTFTVPSGTKLEPGPYVWTGVNAEPAAKPDAPPSNERPIPQVMPYLRFGKQGTSLPPGGLVELTEVRLDAQGAVRGLLRLEQPGSAGLPATSLLGSFSARWCRISAATGSEGS